MNISPDPAIEFAQGILEETNGGIELIEILREIAEGNDEDATTNDLIAANVIVSDRALGKCPTLVSPNPDQTPDTDSPAASDLPTANEEEGACPERSRKVSQINESLNQTLGPAPSAHQHTRHSGGEPAPYPIRGRNPEEWGDAGRHSPQTPEPFDPYSVHYAIQQHILAVTNNGQTLRDALLKVARACPEPVEGAEDDPSACPENEPAMGKAKGRRRITTYHRRRAATILVNRVLGTNPNAVHKAACPDCRKKRTTHDGSHTRAETHPKKKPGRRMSKVDPEALAKARAEIQRMKDEGILTPDPNAPKIDITPYLPPQDFDLSPYSKEIAAKFWANVELTLERQKQWPEIEERRRKKLEQIYPSHSEDDDPPDQ